ncbi:MAG: hypothetical protein FJ125_06135, partial [Deltaproteobacteria bacterium]|nr:hypothetical protein [Deltaproteobacteria bacterium]
MRCDGESHRCEEPGSCRADTDCLGERVCLEASCSLPGGRCFADGDCRAGWVCGTSGRCEPPVGCQDDGQCAPLLCDAARGMCEACLEGRGCPGNQRCVRDGELQRNLCREPEVCGQDVDCLGARVCREGRCAQGGAACADDVFAGNGTAAVAVLLAPGLFPGLVRCDGEADWFAVALEQGQGLQATISFADGLDLSLALFAPGDPFVPLVLSDSALSTEHVALGAAAAAGSYLLRIAGRPGQQGGYVLHLQVQQSFCPPDRLERGGGNDSAPRATLLGPADHDQPGLRLCPRDADWFGISVARASELQLLLLTDDPAMLSLQLFPAGSEVALATGQPDELGLHLAARLEPGSYLLLVAGEPGELGVEYDLQLQLQPAVEVLEERCAAAPLLPLGVQVQGSTAGEPADFLPGCLAADPAAPERIYRVELPQAGSLRVKVRDASSPLLLSLRSSCTEVGSELGCARSPAPLFIPQLDGGSHLLFVEGISHEFAEFNLLAETGVAGPVAGDGCGEPLPVALAPGESLTLPGDTRPASPDFAPLRCGDLVAPGQGQDLVYALSLAQDVLLRPTLETDGWGGLLALYGAACGEGEQQCWLAPGPAEGVLLAAGLHHLVVDGQDTFAAGSFRLTLTADPLPRPPANDRCETAQELVAVVGQELIVAGDTSLAAADHPSSCGLGESRDGGREVVYRLVLGRAARLQATLEAGFHGVLRLVGGACRGEGRLACMDQGTLLLPGLAAGEYFLFVDGYGAADRGSFRLRLRLDEPPSSCQAVAELPVEGVRGSSAQAPASEQGSCGGVGPEVAYRFRLAAAAQVRLLVSGAFGPVLHLRRSCGDPASEIACRAGVGALVVPWLEAGDYTVLVDSAAAAGGSYQLALQLSAPVELPPANDLCENATYLGVLPPAPPSHEGTTLHARAEHGSSCGLLGDPAHGPDVLYRFSLSRRAEVTATLLPGFA